MEKLPSIDETDKTRRQATVALADIEKRIERLRSIIDSLTATGKLSTIVTGNPSNARGKNILTGGSITIEATRGPKKGKRRQLNVCKKCNWPWFSSPPGHRPSACAACNDKNWDKPLNVPVDGVKEKVIGGDGHLPDEGY